MTNLFYIIFLQNLLKFAAHFKTLRSKFFETSLLALLFFGVYVLFTYPLIGSMDELVIGKMDVYQYIWNVYNFQKSLSEGTNPFYSNEIFYPVGVSLWLHTYTPILCLFGLFFDNHILSNNILFAASYVFSGVGAYYLCKRFVKNPLLCFVAGFIFAFSPYKMARLLEHHNLILTATIPFFLLAFLDTFDFQKGFLPKIVSKKHLFLCLLLGFVTFLCDYYLTFFLLFFAFFYGAYYVGGRVFAKWKLWHKVFLLLAIVLISDQLIQWLLRWKMHDNGGIFWGGNLAAFALPFWNSRFLDNGFFSFVNYYYFEVSSTHENVMFLGFTLIACSFLLLAYIFSEKLPAPLRPLAFCLLMFFLLTMPRIKFLNWVIVYSPTALYHFIPFLNKLRCPTRFVLMITLLLPLLSFWVIEQKILLQKVGKLRFALPLCIFILLFTEYYPKTYPFISTNDVPKVYHALAKKEGETLWTIPFGINSGYKTYGKFHTKALFYQQFHRKKLFSGYISHVPDATYEFFLSDSLTSRLCRYPQNFFVNVPPLKKSESEAFIQKFHPDFILIYPEYRSQNVRTYLYNGLLPYIQKEEIIDGYELWTMKK